MANRNIVDPSQVGTTGLRGLNRQSGQKREFDDFGLSESISEFKKKRAASPIELPYQEVGVAGVGDSMYDKNISSLTQLQDLNNTRGELQPWYAQLGAGLGKGVVLAGTTFLDGTIGTIVGAANALDKGEWSAFWDNDFARAMKEVNDWSEQAMPNYRTNEEIQNDQNGEWYKNIFTANWWGDKFIKNLGFTAGAMATGNLVSSAIKSAPVMVKTIVGSAVSAINEGKIEAYNNSNDWYELEREKANDAYLRRVLDIEKNYGGTEMYDAMMQEAKGTFDQTLAKLNEDRAKVGNVDLLLNIPILTASNWFMWGKLYGKGAHTAIRDTKIAMKNGKYASTRTPVKAAFGFLSEGAEEMEQKIAATIPGLKYASEAENFYLSKWDPEASQQSLNWIQSTAQGIAETVGDPMSWEEFTIGALTGGIGMPMFRSARTEDGKWRSPVTIEGGIRGEFKDYREGRDRDQEMVNYLNSRLEDPNFKNYYQGLTRHIHYQNQMDEAAAAGDVLQFKDSEASQFISDITMFDAAGKLNDLTEMINQAYDTSDENLQSIIKNTTDENGNGPYSTNGNAMDKEKMIESLTGDRDNILNKIEQYREVKDNILTNSSPELNDDQIAELVWLNMKHSDFVDRFNEVADEVRDALKMNFAVLEKNGQTVNRDILDLSNIEMLSVLTDSRNESFLAMQGAVRKALNESYSIDNIDVEQKVKDLKKLADRIVEFKDRFEDLRRNPEKLQEATAAADEQIANAAQEEQLAQVRKQLVDAKSFSDISKIVEENQVPDAMLNESTNPLAKEFQRAMSFGAEMAKSINDSNLSDADKQALNQLLDKRFNEEGSYDDLTNPELITEGEVSDNLLNEFQNMIAESRDRANEKSDIPDALPFPQGKSVESETTGNDATATIPVDNKNPYNKLIGEIGNTLDQEYLEDLKIRERIKELESLVAKASSTKNEEDIHKAASALNALLDDLSALPEMLSEDTYNKVQKLVGAIASRIPQLPSASTTETEELNYLDNDVESLPATTENRFYRPALSEYNTQKLAQGIFEPLIVTNPNYQNLYNYLQSKGAFDYVNNGNLIAGDVLTLKPERIGEYDEIVMYKGDQVVGTLPSLTTAKNKNYVGLANLIGKVRKGEAATITVNKVMLGRFKYDRARTQSVKDVVKGDAILGVMKNMNLQTNNDVKSEPVYDEVHSDGKVYLLLKNSRGTYSPKLVRVKHFNSEEFNLAQLSTSGNKSAQKINDILTRLSKITNPDQALTALNELGKVLHLDNTFHISLDNIGGNKVLSVRWIKDGDYTRKNIVVERASSGVFVLGEHQAQQEEASAVDPQDIYNQLLDALYEYNPPFNISAGKINKGTYNQDILNDDLLYTHLTDTQMTGSWFTTNYYDDAGTEQAAVNPKGRSFNPVSGKEGTSVTVGGNRYYVENGNIFDINENMITPDNAGLIKDLAYAESLYGAKTNGATMDRNRIVLPDGRVLNRTTQSYLSQSEADDVKRAIEGRKSKVAIIDSTLQKLQEDQQKVKRNPDGTADTSSGSYMVLEEDGQYHEYSRVHSVIGSNWTGEFSGNSAATMGNLVDDIARRFFGSNEKIERPSNMSPAAFNSLIKSLKQMRTNLENAGEKLLTNRVVIFHKYEDGTRVAGELDALSVNELTGEFNIYDFKTSRYSFHPIKTKEGAVVDYFSSVGSRQTRSNRDQYTLQLSAYKNLFDSSYEGTINSLALVPFVLNYNKEALLGVTAEKGIKLVYNPLVPVNAAKGVKVAETPPVIDKTNELLQPEVKQSPAPDNSLPKALEGYLILKGQVIKGNLRPLVEIQGLPVYYYREPVVTKGLGQQESTLYRHYAVFNNGKAIQVVQGLVGEDVMPEEKAYQEIKNAMLRNPARVVAESQDTTELSGKPIIVQKKNKLMDAVKDLQQVNQSNPEYMEGTMPKLAESPKENEVKPKPKAYDALFNDSSKEFDDLDINTQVLIELSGWSRETWNAASIEERDKGLEQVGCG